jgi:hypothetical protein
MKRMRVINLQCVAVSPATVSLIYLIQTNCLWYFLERIIDKSAILFYKLFIDVKYKIN